MYLFNSPIGEILKIGLFGDIFPDKLARILNGTFLSGGIGICKIDFDWRLSFETEAFGYLLVCGKFAAIVGGNRMYRLPKGEQQPDDRMCRRQGFPPLRQLIHENKVGRTFGKGDDGMTAGVYDGIHFPISEPGSVCLFGPLVYACAIGYIGRFCRAQGFGSPGVFEPKRHMQSQFPGRIGMDMVVDGLLGDVDSLFPEYPRYLGRRPFLLFDHALYSPPQFFRHAVMPFKLVLAGIALPLGICPYILPSGFELRLISRLTVDSDTTMRTAPFLFQTKIYFISLCLD